jgi:hypothetical protein
VSDKVREALVEFCRDIEAAGIKYIVEEDSWPDLLSTYRKAKEVLGESIPHKDWVALAVYLDDARLCESCEEDVAEHLVELSALNSLWLCNGCKEGRENRESDWSDYNQIIADGLRGF